MRPTLESLKIRPEKFISDYLLSKEAATKKKTQWDLLISPQLTLERHRRDFISTEDRLKNKRLQFVDRKKELDTKWDEIAAEGQNLKSNLTSFNHFLVANLEKRKRASELLHENQKLLKEREQAVVDLKHKIDELGHRKVELDKQVANHLMYEKFLKNVVAAFGDKSLKNADHVVSRFEKLSQVAHSLARSQSDAFETLQNAKMELGKFTETNEEILLGLHTRAAGLRGRYESACRRVRHLEDLVHKIRTKFNEKYADLATTKTATYNLYVQICCYKMTAPRIARDDFERQLVFIGRNLRQLHQLNVVCTTRIGKP